MATDVRKDLTGLENGIQNADAQARFICSIDDKIKFWIDGKDASVLEIIIRHNVNYNNSRDPNTEPLHHVRFRAWETSEKGLPFSVDGIITDKEPTIYGVDAVIVKLIINNIIELEEVREMRGVDASQDFDDQIYVTRPYPTYGK